MAQVIDLLLFLIPIYIANSSPVVLGGGEPLDLGIILGDGKRLFGEGKTIRGFIGGVAAGTVAGGLLSIFYILPFFLSGSNQFIGAFLLSFGALSGDALGSFIKRRSGIDSGKPFIIDTVLFLLIGLILVFPFVNQSLYEIPNLAFFIVLTMILHPLTNILANKAGLKNVPW